jgi:dihydrofolate reductase/thymidylate synthase
VLSAWQVSDLTAMALPRATQSPSSSTSGTGNCCSMYQRSVDGPWPTLFNIASYAMLTCMIAQVCDLRPGDLSIKMGITSTYHMSHHFATSARAPVHSPTLRLDPTIKDIDDFVVESICIGLCAASGNRHVDVLTRLFPPYSRLRDSLMHLCKCSTIGWDL